MTASFFDEIKSSFRQHENGLTQLILINVIVYVVINLLDTLLFLADANKAIYDQIVRFLSVPASFKLLIFRPWTLFTYMFLHESFFHILFNMLWLYWLGKIFHEYLGNKKLIAVYILGGLAGGLLYIISFNIFPVFRSNIPFSYALGASASVLAIIVAAATLLPNYTIYLLFLGPVKLKYIALFSVVLDFLSISKGNAGGHIAHLGGAIFGYIFIKQLQRGNDLGQGFQKFTDSIINAFSFKNRLKVSYKSPINPGSSKPKKDKQPNQDVIDAILDKIAKSGYDSLTKEEKDVLFRISKDNK